MLLGRSFVLGSSWDVPGTDRDPTRGIPRKPLNNGRERFLSAEEAARLRELLDARWENVDVKRWSWLIPTSKTGKPRHVPLSTAAVAIIENCRASRTARGWNPDTRLPFVSIKHAWQKAIKVAKLPGLRLHDLRHSAASFMVNSGVDLFAVGKVLGHASYQSTQRYSHLANDTLLKAVEAGAAKQVAA